MHRGCYILGIILCAWLLQGCRGDEPVYPSEENRVTNEVRSGGLYVLNEGNMGSNKCQLDYMNLRTGIYTRNIYGAQNPKAVKELGDVGNDIAQYGSRLYAVINCSHKVEVMDLAARRIGQVDLPNCRNMAFADGNMYVSAYVGSVADPDMLGAVYEVDTATLKVTREVQVGHQPDELTIVGNTLYVCNSGGYLTHRYDSTLSCIDLATLTVRKTIDVGINPGRVRADSQGRLWVTCRGDYAGRSPQLVLVENEQVTQRLDMPCDNIGLFGDSLFVLDATGKKMQIIHTKTLQQRAGGAFDAALALFEKPYGMLVTADAVYLTDAHNYVSSGTLCCYSRGGRLRWQAQTGDIPGHLLMVDVETEPLAPVEEETSPYISRVYEYCPATGQFVNTMPAYEEGDNAETMAAKCLKCIGGKRRTGVTLGGWGGYITFGFDHAVQNVPGERDIWILGNAFAMTGNAVYGSSEPGIVLVAHDDNANGLPDDPWYELAGSEYHKPETDHHYTRTYTRADDTRRNSFHPQPWYPQWYDEERSFTGARLGVEQVQVSGQYVMPLLDYGYADNRPNKDTLASSFDIGWAVDDEGQPVALSEIHFVRVYTAVEGGNAITGELSTEITGAVDLHKLHK